MSLPQPIEALQPQIDRFLASFLADLRQLSQALEQAGISHYSSGCGSKSVTFDLFPAHAYVDEMIRMLDLQRNHKDTLYSGFKDASPQQGYNPGHDFMLYLKRWQHFAEQAMQREGSSQRGIIASRAKLLAESLVARLSEGKAGAALKTTRFCRMMEAISAELAQKAKTEKAKLAALHRENVNNHLAEVLAQVQSANVNRASAR